MIVETVKVELAGVLPSVVGEEGSNVQVAAFGRFPHVKFTALLNPFDGVTNTVYEVWSPETITLSAGETESE